MTLSQSDHYPWIYYIFFVNNDIIIISVFLTNAFFSPSQRNCPAAEANDTTLHTTNTVATQEPTPKPQGTCSVGDYAVYKKKIKNCVRGLRRNGNNSASMWLTNDNAIRQRCRRLRGCVDADGGQFEHYDWHSDYHSGRHCRFLSVWL